MRDPVERALRKPFEPVKFGLGVVLALALTIGMVSSWDWTPHAAPSVQVSMDDKIAQGQAQYNDDPSYNDPWCLQGHRVPNSVEEMMRCESTESLKEYCSKSDKIPSNKIACDYVDQHRR